MAGALVTGEGDGDLTTVSLVFCGEGDCQEASIGAVEEFVGNTSSAFCRGAAAAPDCFLSTKKRGI